MDQRIAFLFATLATAYPGTQSQAQEPPRVTVLPAGGAWIERAALLPSSGEHLARATFPLPATLRPETLLIRLSPEGRPLPLILDAPLIRGPSWLTGCLGQTVRLLAPGQGEGGLPEAGDVELLVTLPGGQALVRLEDGSIASVPAARIVCHPSRPVAEWRVTASLPEKAGKKGAPSAAWLRYRVDDWSWEAVHRVGFDPRSLRIRLSSQARIIFPGQTRLPECRMTLLAGEVPEIRPPSPPRVSKMARTAADYESFGAGPAEREAADLLVFELPGLVRPVPGGEVQVPLREMRELPVEDVLLAEAPIPHRGGGDERRLEARRQLRFVNDGERPLPRGRAIVGIDEKGRQWSPLGTVWLERTPPGGKARLDLGRVRDLTLEWKRVSAEPLAAGTFRQSVSVEILVGNPRKLPAQVEIRQPMGGPFEVIGSEPEPATSGGTSLTWVLRLAPGASARIAFSARVDPRPRRGR